MTAFQNILSQEIVQRIGWTLVHFIWQGTAIAFVVAIVLAFLRNKSSNFRYATAFIALILMAVAPLITYKMINIPTASAPASPIIVQNQKLVILKEVKVNAQPSINQNSPEPVKSSFIDKLINETESILPHIVICWLAGVFILSIWHLGGWTQLQKLRKKMVSPVSDEIKSKVAQLSNLLGIQKAVNIFQSILVNAPTVIGHFKPVILLPASALTGLSSEQIDAILAHELAHIKRCDYLINILQTVVEIFGFYHPAVWWVSNKIRQERENCCDDMAVQITGDKFGYAQALTTMEEIRFLATENTEFTEKNKLAVAASGGNLFERIKRLVGRKNSENERADWLPSIITFFLIAALLISVGLTSSSCDNEKLTQDGMNVKINQINIDTATRKDIVKVFGEPEKYMWGNEKLNTVQTMDKDNLGSHYIMLYPNDFRVFIANDKIVEFRFEGPSDYVFDGGLVVGSSLEKAIKVLGEPKEILDGEKIEFKDNVLYKNIKDKPKGTGYYAVSQKHVRIWLNDDKVMAIYVTRNDYSDGGPFNKKLKQRDLPKGSTIDAKGHIIDKIDYPFVNDPEALGGWEAVDFVHDINNFKPGKKTWSEDLFLKELFFLENGKTNWAFSWTKGLLLHSGEKTASKYIIKEMNGSRYMFMEWKSGDYTIRHIKPLYYVLKFNPNAVYIESKTIDKVDYPFVNDPEVLGRWESVDFVKNIGNFNPGKKQWIAGDLFLKEMTFEKDGRVICKNGPGTYTQKWTRGLVLGKITASKYTIQMLDNSQYMFFEWKSGDYTIRHMKPQYYVLKKVEDTNLAEVPAHPERPPLPPPPPRPYDPPTKKIVVNEINKNIANFLDNSGIEEGKGDLPSSWFEASVPAEGLKMYRDTENVHSGKYSLTITNTHKYDQTVSNNWAQNIQNVPVGTAIKVSTYIKTENADSANVCIQCWSADNSEKMLAITTTNILRGDNNWVLLESPPVLVPEGTTKITVRAVLSGTGKVWFDDIKVNTIDISDENKNTSFGQIGEKYEDNLKDNTANFKQKLEEPVTVNVAKSPDGDRLTIQYAVIAICDAAKVPYNWNKSAKLADPQRTKYIESVNIENKVASQAIADLIGPVGLSFSIDEKGVYIYKPEKIQGESNFEILDVNFEPIHQGKNIVWITVKNKTDKEQFFSVNVYSRSVDYGPSGVGWGTIYREKFDAEQTKKLRYAYKIQGPVTKNTYIRLSFANVPSLDLQEHGQPFLQKQYAACDLPFAPVVVRERILNEEMAKEVWKVFNSFQKAIKDGDYEKAWNIFSDDYKQSEYQVKGFEAFKSHMQPKHPLEAAFHWDKKNLTMLKWSGIDITDSTIEEYGGPILEAKYNNQKWKFKFIHDPSSGNWKIDDITGYTPKIVEMQEQETKN
jgi:beta-lactamase regulating signal transducer with metallopeptidase domain